MTCKHPDYDECPDSGGDYHGRCLGACIQCGAHLECTGRYTVYCPSCDVCPSCGCPNADGFQHHLGCQEEDLYAEAHPE